MNGITEDPEEVKFIDKTTKENGEKCCSILKKFPLTVYLIIGNEFCERFSFYGMRAILVIYFIVEHHFTDAQAILVFHAFCSLAYLSPLFGSVAADNHFGKYRVIVGVSVVYVLGHVLLTLGPLIFL